MAEQSEHTGAMIALIPSDNDLDRLTLDGGEPRDEIHLTLWFLGDADAFDSEMRDGIINAVRGMVERRKFTAMRGYAFGINHWNPGSDEPAWVLAVGDFPDDEREHEPLGVFRSGIAESWHDGMIEFDLPAQHSPWSPHITIAYNSDTDMVDVLKERLGAVTFDKVRLAFGSEVTDIPLTPSYDTMTASVGGDAVPWSKEKGHSGCPSDKPWAVVKDGSGEVEGCHTSESAADKQLAALYASESDKSVSTDATSLETDCADCGVDPEHFGSTSGAVSTKPWDGSSGRFTDEQWQMSTAGCDTEGTTKERCFLPHHEPGGATNRNGVHAAAARINQVNASPEAIARAKAHLRSHYRQLNEEPPDVLKATVTETVVLKSDADTECQPGHHKMPDGECMPDEDMQMTTSSPTWSGTLVVEGTTTGDGREFAHGALTWAELPLPLRWNYEDSHGGTPQTRSVLVGRIDKVSRDGNKIIGSGVFDLGRPEGREAYRLVKEKFLRGISIDADDISDADLEFIFPEESDETSAMMPEKVILNGGRIRAATLVDIPAFVEAYIQLDDATTDDVGVMASTDTHITATTDEPWDGDANKRKLPNLMNTGVAASAYAWIDQSAIRGERFAKTGGAFLHHMIDDDGKVGAANLTACSSGIGALNSGREFSHLSIEDRRAAYDHLAAHLRDAGMTPPAPKFLDESARVASIITDERPPPEWFTDPKLSVPTPITVTDAGRVYGHAAEWETCHVGFPDICVTPPEEEYHPYFMTGEVVCSNGQPVAVGQITVGTGHAPLSYGASRAAEHYDDTGAAVADVVVGNDAHGIWVAGAIRPGTDIAKVRQLRAAGQVSGDWRRIGGQLRLVGLLAVNVPGYPVPRLRTRVASGAPHALVAAGRISVGRPHETEDEINKRAMRALADRIANRIGRARGTENVLTSDTDQMTV